MYKVGVVKKSLFTILLIFIVFFSCKKSFVPKPTAYLALSFPKPEYRVYKSASCPYYFEYASTAKLKNANNLTSEHWYTVTYPHIKGAIHLSYYPVKNHLRDLIRDAQNLTQQHVVKADEISYHPYIDTIHKVYGMLYQVKGNAASNVQFYVTDSVSHFITAAVYIKNRPDYDSLLPAIKYLENDARHLIETLRWVD